MTDEVLAVKYSPNNRFLAVALLDATVKIFYHDTLKFFLSLYGHKVNMITEYFSPCLSSFLLASRAITRHFFGLKAHYYLLG